MDSDNENKWLLLIHQIPPKPSYFRVKIWRRLQQLGAVAIKQSVYVLPLSDQTIEDFSWLLREIKEGRGEASLCEAAFIDGITDQQIIALFREARKADYEQIINEGRSIPARGSFESNAGIEDVSHAAGQLVRLRKKMAELVAIDYFACPERGVAEVLLSNLEERLKGAKSSRSINKPRSPHELAGKTWVTRNNVYIDRIACAWLIRRFVDPGARFKFINTTAYKPQSDEMRFDMLQAEYTHDGDLCSFEVMVRRFGLNQRLFAPLAEMVHDIDLKDQKYARPETAGIQAIFTSIVTAHPTDEDRIEIGGKILDDLFDYYQQQVKA
jgi:hypothetical protein